MTTMHDPSVSGEDEGYTLLLHSLTHEHIEENYDRHCLLFEKWCRDYAGGVFVCHLKYVLPLLGILRQRLESHGSIFLPILPLVLKVLSAPLLEAKANERLRSAGIEDIKKLYFEIAKFFEFDANSRKAVAICFRCIVNGGIDPTALRADAIEWVSDGNSAQIKDINYIQTLFRESNAVEAVVCQFQWCVESYLYELQEFHSASSTIGSPVEAPGATSRPGVLSRQNSQQNDSDDDDDIAGRSNAEDATVAGSEDMSTYVSTKKMEASIMQELSRAMLDLCLDLAKNKENAAFMCKLRVCDAAIKLLGESVSSGSCRDERVCITVELLWTVLEAYFSVDETMDVYDSQVLENLRYGEVIEFEPAISTLKDVLLQLLREGYKLADKEVRNEVLIVLTIIAKFPAAFPSFVKSGLLTVLVTYACIGESGKKAWPFLSQPLAKLRNFATVFEVDLQLKRELWMLIGDLLRYDDIDAITCVASSPLLIYMQSFLDRNSLVEHAPVAESIVDEPPPTAPTDSVTNEPLSPVGFESILNSSSSFNPPGFQLSNDLGGPPPLTAATNSFEMTNNSILMDTKGSSLIKVRQRPPRMTHVTQLDKDSKATATYLTSIPATELRELQVLVMIFLAENAHKMMGEFMRIDGPLKALDIIYTYCTSTFAEHKRLVYHALLLQNRCIMNSNSAKQILETESAIQIWLYVFEISDEDSTRAVAARLIAIMCSRNMVCQQQLRQLKGVELFVKALSTYTDLHKPVVGKKSGIKLGQHTDNDLENPEEYRGGGEVSVLIVAVLDCLTKGVVGNPRNEAKLAQVEGIDALLDLLEVSEFLLRIKVLRLLSDLLQNQRLIPYVNAWRSAKTMRSAAQIFCHSYIDEETRLNCSRDNGVINNLWNPLGNHDWPRDISIPPPEVLLSGNDAKSMTVTRLTNAILASRNVNGNGMTDHVRNVVLQRDTRGIIVSVLNLMGLLHVNVTCPNSPDTSERGGANGRKSLNQSTIDGMRKNSNVHSSGEFQDSGFIDPQDASDEPSLATSEDSNEIGVGGPSLQMSDDEQHGITPLEKQVISIAKRFDVLKEGEWWLGVSLKLKEEGISPIDADLQMIDGHLSRYFEAARTVQFEQMELHQLNIRIKENQENIFINSIISKKNAQIKAEWLKKNSKMTSKQQNILTKIR